MTEIQYLYSNNSSTTTDTITVKYIGSYNQKGPVKRQADKLLVVGREYNVKIKKVYNYNTDYVLYGVIGSWSSDMFNEV